jgi:uncharacterized protein (TIGR02996 family)
MPRYELVEGNSSKFWEIELEGTSFTTRFGRIGTDGQTSTKQWKSVEEAKKQYDKIIAEKVKKGYELVDGEAGGGDDEGGAVSATNPELEKAIFDDPDAPDGYLVYGDWLQSQGDPLGELVAVQAALAKKPGDEALEKKQAEILKEHEDEWLGETLSELKSNGELSTAWRYGLLKSVAMGGDEFSEASAKDAYEALARCRAAKFLRDLEIRVFDTEDGNPEYQACIDAMAKKGLPKTLRSLAFDVKDFQISWSDLGDLSKLYPQLQKLEELRLKIGQMNLGKIELPSLEKLEIVTGGFDAKNMKAIATAKWPKLESLVLYLGSDDYGGNCSIDDVEPILTGKAIPNVKHLGLCNSELADDIARAVAKSKVLAQLRTLDLSKGTMGDDGARAILDDAKAFAHLEKIDLSDNYISDDLCAALEKALGEGKVDTTSQGDGEDPDDRYVQISE